MSQMGHSRRFLGIQLTSASPSIAVIGVRCSERLQGPQSDIAARTRTRKVKRAPASHRHDLQREAADEQPVVQRLSQQ
jgi:hypothetical protein